MEEIWKDIEGYEGFYQVSNLGQVRSIPRMIKNHLYDGKILSPISNGYGYMTVKLCKAGVCKKHYVHILVATAFLKKTNKNLEVNHKNYNKKDNRSSNLEWVTHEENCEDARKHYGIKKQIHVCPICGNQTSTEGCLCIKCWKLKHEKKIPNRNDLIQDLLIRNFIQIGLKYHVTDNAVRKWCKKYKLPYQTKVLIQMNDDEILSLIT